MANLGRRHTFVCVSIPNGTHWLFRRETHETCSISFFVSQSPTGCIGSFACDTFEASPKDTKLQSPTGKEGSFAQSIRKSCSAVSSRFNPLRARKAFSPHLNPTLKCKALEKRFNPQWAEKALSPAEEPNHQKFLKLFNPQRAAKALFTQYRGRL